MRAVCRRLRDRSRRQLRRACSGSSFQSFEGEGTDPLAGMFENLLSLEDRILNVFTQKEVEATRLLFTQ